MRVFYTSLSLRISRSCGQGDTCTARGAPGCVFGVGETKQTFPSQPDGVALGTQPVCAPLSGAALKADSERRCVVSCTSDCSIEEGTAVWPGYDERSLDERQRSHGRAAGSCANLRLGSSLVSDCSGTLYSHTGTVSCPSGYVASDVYDTVFKCLVPPCITEGTLPRCDLLVGPGQDFDGLEDVAHPRNGVGLGDHGGAVTGTYPCACGTTAPS